MTQIKWAAPVTYGASKFEVMTDELHARPVAVVNTLEDAHLVSAAPAMLQALRRAVLALAFAAETSPAMRDDYNAVSDAIAKATGA